MFRENGRLRRAPALPIDFKRHEWDAKVRAYGKKGFFATTIQKKMPELTIHQIRGRLDAAGIHPNKFRSGQSESAREALAKVDSLIRSCQFARRNIAGVLRDRDHGRRGRPVKLPMSA